MPSSTATSSRRWAATSSIRTNGTPVYSQVILQYQSGKNQVVWPKEFRTAEPIIRLAP